MARAHASASSKTFVPTAVCRVGASFLLSLACLEPVGAQEAKTLDEVIVTGAPVKDEYLKAHASTGTKTDTPIMETPLSVQAVDLQVIEDQQAVSLRQVLQNISGVFFIDGQSTYSSERSNGVSIRGFTVNTYYTDGSRVEALYGGTDIFSSRQMANVESVEVLKGPGAILYGLIEPGGIVNVVKKEPSATPSYSAEQQVGSNAYYRTTAGLTGPLTEDHALTYRLDASYESNGAPFGYRIDLVSSQDLFVAPVIKWDIDPANSLKFEGEINRQRIDEYAAFHPILDGQWVNVPTSTNYGEKSPNAQNSNSAALTWAHKFNENWSIKEKTTYTRIIDDYSSQTPNNLYAFSLGQQDYSYSAALIPSNQAVYVQLFGGQFQLPSLSFSSTADVVGHLHLLGAENTVLLGASYYWSRANDSFENQSNNLDTVPIPNHQPIPGYCFNCNTSYGDNESNDGGFYFQDQIKLPGEVQLLAGERYQRLRQESGGATTSLASVVPFGTQKTWTAWTPRLGILLRPRNWVSLYSNFAEGFGSNGTALVYNPVGPSANYAPPSNARTWEVGAKFEPAKDKLLITVAYFDLTKTNQTATDPIASHNQYCPPYGCSIILGETKSRGYELDAQGELMPGWQLIGNYTYDNNNVISGGSAWVPYFPHVISNLWTSYEFQAQDLKGWKIGGGYHHIGQRAATPPAPWLSGYGTWDAMASYVRNLGRTKVTAQVNVGNLFNSRAISYEYILGALGPGYSEGSGVLDYIPERMITGLVRAEF